MDFTKVLTAQDIFWYTDSSGVIGMGGICNKILFKSFWSKDFITQQRPSIDYLELYAVTVSVLLWAKLYTNRRIRLNVDNQGVMWDVE